MKDGTAEFKTVDARVAAIFSLVYPVGSLYWSSQSVDPATLFGGSWKRIKDKFILAAGDSYAAGNIGGEANHTLTTEEMPRHNHEYTFDQNDSYNWHIGLNQGGAEPQNSAIAQGPQGRSFTMRIQYAGGSRAHNNMPPYITYYCWERVA